MVSGSDVACLACRRIDTENVRARYTGRRWYVMPSQIPTLSLKNPWFSFGCCWYWSMILFVVLSRVCINWHHFRRHSDQTSNACTPKASITSTITTSATRRGQVISQLLATTRIFYSQHKYSSRWRRGTRRSQTACDDPSLGEWPCHHATSGVLRKLPESRASARLHLLSGNIDRR